MVIYLERGADLHMAQLMPLPLTFSCFSKIQIVLPFWYQLTRVVLDKGPLNGCVYVCFICICNLQDMASCLSFVLAFRRLTAAAGAASGGETALATAALLWLWSAGV